MNDWLSSLVDSTVQCWGCGAFDRLFQIVSDAAALAYDKFVSFCIVLFCIMFSFFVLSAVWKTMRGNVNDPLYENSIQRVFINAIICLGLLGMGVAVPRFITSVTFEPVAQIAQTYTQSMINIDAETVAEKVTYQPQPMSDDGFYRPELRDKIIMLMKTTITQFQSYVKLGIAVMDSAFSWSALLGVGALIKHIFLFFIGLALTWGMLKLFFRYCCYFADVIIEMAYFAFFFPLSLALFAFDGAENMPKWMSGIGKNVGVNRFKNLINAIITLASAIITYTVIMAIIAKFMSDPDVSSADLMNAILEGKIFETDLSLENLEAMTLASSIVLVYVLNYIADQIPQVSNMITSVFGVKEEKQLSEQLANYMSAFVEKTINKIQKTAEKVIKKEDKK